MAFSVIVLSVVSGTRWCRGARRPVDHVWALLVVMVIRDGWAYTGRRPIRTTVSPPGVCRVDSHHRATQSYSPTRQSVASVELAMQRHLCYYPIERLQVLGRCLICPFVISACTHGRALGVSMPMWGGGCVRHRA
ncbi:hypothetical protein JB92DRAFT_1227666 [Gautieria morchelliformis]|nr:hypothetical protein JB92DRAFT_1227666 [Gautieria morchelliformis]